MDPLVIGALVKLGGTASRAAFRLWSKDALGQSVAGDLGELASKRISGLLEQRKAARAFSDLGDQVATRLEEMIAVEFPRLESGETAAAVDAVERSISLAELDIHNLLSFDLEASRLEGYIRSVSGEARANAVLGGDGTALYDLLLSEASAYIVEVATRLPEFGGSAALEALRRNSTLIELVTEVLRRLPPASSVAGAMDEDGRFERRYSLAASSHFDRLELFGLDVSASSRRYSLSVAYISLTAAVATPAGGSGDEGDLDLDQLLEISGDIGDAGRSGGSHELGRDDADIDLFRIEQVLAGARRLLLRGDAGLGKTTLLQWLAVNAARDGFSAELVEWNGRVPFLLKLRDYVGRDLPTLDRFVDGVSTNLRDFMPSGWVGRVFDSGRALLMIDGIDEMPEDDRPSSFRWLEQILVDFPETVMIVTSRPAAVASDWGDVRGFETADLQPMSDSDIRAFVDHWHDAAAMELQTDAAAVVSGLRSRLLAMIAETPAIKNLAMTPLLCAMLCALNRDRRSKLPKERTELYRIALELLLERRDSERDVHDLGVVLSLPDRRACFRNSHIGSC